MVISIYKQQEPIRLDKRTFLSKFDLLIETLAKKSGKLIKIQIKDKKKINEFNKLNIETHLNITLNDLYSLAFLSLGFSIFIGILLFIIFSNFLITLFFLILGVLSYQFVMQYPYILRNKLRTKKRNQLLNLILLVAIKLRSNQSLESALEYSLKYIKDPLRYDILKLLWDTYNKKYYNIVDAIDYYTKNWEDDAPYFVYSMQLLIASTYESSPETKEAIIDKAIETALDVLYDRMSLIIRELHGPINLTYMLGILLPTLLLTIFPLSSILLPDIFGSRFLFVFFDLVVPLLLLLIIKGFIEGKQLEVLGSVDPELIKKSEENKRKYNLFTILSVISLAFLMLFIGIFILGEYISKIQLSSILFSSIFVLSLGISIGFGFRLYYRFFESWDRTIDSINKELPSFLFSISIRMRENVPLENVFLDIYPKFRKKHIGGFIADVIRAMKIRGMSLYSAIFDEKRGVIKQYPSSYLKFSMENVVENSQINPYFASKTAIALYKYFAYIARINLKLQDLVAEVVSQMKMLSRLVGPMILGIVTGMAIMSINIMYNLGLIFENIRGLESGIYGQEYNYYNFAGDLLNVFSFKNIISPASIYIIVGIYNILISVIIAYLLNIIENGKNPIKEKQYISVYVIRSTIVYTIFGTASSLILWSFANMITSGMMF